MNILEEPLLMLLHLAILSTFWGLQIWYTFFTSFLMRHVLNRHMYGYIQSLLLPFYHRIGCACAFFSLIIFVMYHPQNPTSDKDTFQIIILFACVMAATLNFHYFGAITWEIMADMHRIEQSWGIDKNIVLSASSETYDTLSQSSPQYKRLSFQLCFYQWLSFLCNLCCIICNSCSICYLTQNLCTPL